MRLLIITMIRIYKKYLKEKAVSNFNNATAKGILKVMNKIGISTLNSYRGSQIFEALGLKTNFINKYFKNTPTRIEGVGLYVLKRKLVKELNMLLIHHQTLYQLKQVEITDGEEMVKAIC